MNSPLWSALWITRFCCLAALFSRYCTLFFYWFNHCHIYTTINLVHQGSVCIKQASDHVQSHLMQSHRFDHLMESCGSMHFHAFPKDMITGNTHSSGWCETFFIIPSVDQWLADPFIGVVQHGTTTRHSLATQELEIWHWDGAPWSEIQLPGEIGLVKAKMQSYQQGGQQGGWMVKRIGEQSWWICPTEWTK